MADTASNDRFVTQQEGVIEQALRIVRRRKWVVLQATIAVPVIALLFSVTQRSNTRRPRPCSSGSRRLSIGESNSLVDPTREAATNGELATLPVVAEQAAKKLSHGVSSGEVLSSISVTPATEAETAAISATTESPTLSAEMANAYGNAYIAFRRSADRSQLQNAINLAESSLESMTPIQRAGTEGRALTKQLDQLKLTQALQTGGAELVQPASAPSSPSSPQTKRNVEFGLLLGLLLGFGLAAVLERIDRTVRSTEELETPLRVAGPRLASPAAEGLLAQARLGTQTPEGEAFRVLRTNLRYFDVDRDLRSILVVSPEEETASRR